MLRYAEGRSVPRMHSFLKQGWWVLLLISGLQGQDGFGIIFGFSKSEAEYNDPELTEELINGPVTGITVGGEIYRGPYVMGISYIQRGAFFSPEAGRTNTYFRYDTWAPEIYNYLAVTLGLYWPIIDRISVFFGGELNWGLGGVMGTGYGREILSADELALDYGPIAAVEFKVNSTMSFRYSYYWGMADVITEIPHDLNWRNRGAMITLLLKNVETSSGGG